MINSKNVDRVERAYNSNIISGDFYPSVYVLEPTSLCNLTCPMCPNSFLGTQHHGFISVEHAAAIARKVNAYAELMMLYFMGEPLMHPQIFEIVSAVRKEIKGKLVISTNGCFLSQTNRDGLLNSGIDVVICSVDGFTKRAYEKMRRGARFEEVTSNIKSLLYERKGPTPQIIVKCIDAGISKDDSEKFISEWRDLGASTHISWLNDWAGTFSTRTPNSAAYPYLEADRKACADLWFKMVINWRGDVVLCCVDWKSSITLGNILHNDLHVLWHGDVATRARRNHVESSWNNISVCRSCTQPSQISEQRIYVTANPDSYDVIF